MIASFLELTNLTKRFRGIAAVNGLDLTVKENEILAIIGPNGSGKTTLFNLISGFLKPSAGEIKFGGARIDGERPDQLVRRGIARTFQQAMSFPHLTVYENVAIPMYASDRSSLADIDRIVSKCGLQDVSGQQASTLPYGKQRKLGIAIALATRPRLLLLDEPGAGLGDDAATELSALIRGIRDEGRTVLLIDHEMPFVLPIADRVVVMESGRKLFEGTSNDVVSDSRVVEVYLGHDFA